MKIIIGTDGSDFSKAAIGSLAQIIVRPENTSVKIISALQRLTPITTEPFAISAEYFNAIEERNRHEAHSFVIQAEEQIRALFPNATPDLSTEVIMGPPQRAIVERAEEWGADWIVVGSHGYGFWSRAMLGSVSSSVVHHAPCSVIVVRMAHDSDKSS